MKKPIEHPQGKRITLRDNPITAATGNYVANMHYTYKAPTQILQ
jgi:hypothetical protein